MTPAKTILRHMLDDAGEGFRYIVHESGITYASLKAFDAVQRKMVATPEALLFHLAVKFTSDTGLPPTIDVLATLVGDSSASFHMKAQARECLLTLPTISLNESELRFAIDKVKAQNLDDEIKQTIVEASTIEDPQERLRYINLRTTTLGEKLQPAHEKTQSIQEVYKQIVDRYRAMKMGLIDDDAIPLGFDVFDSETGGVEPGTLTVFAGCTGTGKSMVLAHVTLQAALKGLHVVFATKEMYTYQQAWRMIGNLAGIPYRRIPRAKLEDYEEEAMYMLEEKIGELRIHLIPPSRCYDLDVLSAELQIIHKDNPINMLVVDYLNIVGPGSLAGKSVSEYLRQKVVAESLRGYGQTYHCPVITAAQLARRAVGRDDPSQADVGLSGEITNTAEYMLFWIPMRNTMSSDTYKVACKKARFSSDVFAFEVKVDFSRAQIFDGGAVSVSPSEMAQATTDIGGFLSL